MSVQANLDLVRKGYAAFSAGDAATLSVLMSPDVVHIVAGSSPLSGPHKGIEAVLTMYGQLAELSAGTIKVDLQDVVSDGGNRVIAIHRSSGTRPDGRSLSMQEALLFTISDGKVVEIQDFFADIEAQDAFWA
jgi:ketosteroid isomerase-like protein